MSPKKFEKPKDKLFIDFFGMYAKKFIEESNTNKKDTRKGYSQMNTAMTLNSNQRTTAP